MTKKKKKTVSVPNVLTVAKPDLTPVPEERGAWYWVGLLPDCPRNGVTVGGIAINKVTETLEKVPGQQKGTRTPHPGCVMRLTPAKLKLIAERIGRTLLRTMHAPAEHGTGEDIGDPVRGVPYISLPVPTAEELETMTTTGRRRYKPVTPRKGDLALGDYVFLVPCGSDTAPRPMGMTYPEPVSKAGIVLADDPLEEPVEELVPKAPEAETEADGAELIK